MKEEKCLNCTHTWPYDPKVDVCSCLCHTQHKDPTFDDVMKMPADKAKAAFEQHKEEILDSYDTGGALTSIESIPSIEWEESPQHKDTWEEGFDRYFRNVSHHFVSVGGEKFVKDGFRELLAAQREEGIEARWNTHLNDAFEAGRAAACKELLEKMQINIWKEGTPEHEGYVTCDRHVRWLIIKLLTDK